ncbi:MAG: tyrosine-type recombinase/integrase [Colwellia sp.]|nr:tyrosine-type recombinase/integrase [Colwellia sp.]
MSVTVNFECKKYVSKDGKIPLAVRIWTENNGNQYLKLGWRIEASLYDFKNHKLKKGFNGADRIRKFVTSKIMKINGIITQLELEGQVITFSEIKKRFEKGDGIVRGHTNDFYAYVDSELQKEKASGDLAGSTIDGWYTKMKFMKKYYPRLRIHELSVDFIADYISTLRRDMEAGEFGKTSIFAQQTFLRKYTLRLFHQGILSEHLFANRRLKVGGAPVKSDDEVVYLEPEEMDELRALYDSLELTKIEYTPSNKFARKSDTPSGVVMQRVLHNFLKGCYTGMRFGDIKSFDINEHIQGNYLVKEMDKSRRTNKKKVRIPLMNPLLEILDIERSNEFGLGHCYTLDHCNRVMKNIVNDHTSINKVMSSHVARHTFAVNSIILGIDIYTIKDFLGHSSIETTQRYARVVDSIRKEAIEKWNNRLIEQVPSLDINIQCPECAELVMSFKRGAILNSMLDLKCDSCKHEFQFAPRMAEMMFMKAV